MLKRAIITIILINTIQVVAMQPERVPTPRYGGARPRSAGYQPQTQLNIDYTKVGTISENPDQYNPLSITYRAIYDKLHALSATRATDQEGNQLYSAKLGISKPVYGREAETVFNKLKEMYRAHIGR